VHLERTELEDSQALLAISTVHWVHLELVGFDVVIADELISTVHWVHLEPSQRGN